jgi:hypothetical protein
MKMIILVLALISSSMALAQTKLVSIDAFDYSYTGGFSFKHNNTANDDDEDTTNFKFNLNYAQNWEEYVGLMWKAKAYFNRQSTELDNADTLDSHLGIAGGFLYNFDYENIKESMFAAALVGLERSAFEKPRVDDKSGFNIFLDLEAGKRWDLGSYSVVNISYAPSLAFNWKRYGGDLRDDYYKSGYEFKLNFLKFDILF